MKSIQPSLIILSAFLFIPRIGAQHEQAVPLQSPTGNGFFAYADYYHYIGAGSMGELVNPEGNYLQLTKFSTVTDDPMYTNGYGTKFETYVPRKPSGSIVGETVGYTWNDKAEDRYFLQLSYRSGTQNTLLGYMKLKGSITGIYYSDYQKGTPKANTYTSDFVYDFEYKQETDEYRINFLYSPHSMQYLTFGIEYAYGEYKGTITNYLDGHKSYVNLYADGKYYYDLDGDNVDDKGKEEFFSSVYPRDYDHEAQYFYGFSQNTHDILLHITLKTAEYKLLSILGGILQVQPRVDIGVGYSIRNGKIEPGHWIDDPTIVETVLTDDAKEILSRDKAVLESTAALSLYYTLGNTSFMLDGGFRYKTDIMSKNYGSDVKGFYARIGMNYSW
jgi:hypothetical protein